MPLHICFEQFDENRFVFFVKCTECKLAQKCEDFTKFCSDCNKQKQLGKPKIE